MPEVFNSEVAQFTLKLSDCKWIVQAKQAMFKYSRQQIDARNQHSYNLNK